MVFEGNYKIMIQDDDGNYSICVRMPENGMIARFDCVYAADKYAKEHGVVSGYIVKK
jgi:hypothetical protein